MQFRSIHNLPLINIGIERRKKRTAHKAAQRQILSDSIHRLTTIHLISDAVHFKWFGLLCGWAAFLARNV